MVNAKNKIPYFVLTLVLMTACGSSGGGGTASQAGAPGVTATPTPSPDFVDPSATPDQNPEATPSPIATPVSQTPTPTPDPGATPTPTPVSTPTPTATPFRFSNNNPFPVSLYEMDMSAYGEPSLEGYCFLVGGDSYCWDNGGAGLNSTITFWNVFDCNGVLSSDISTCPTLKVSDAVVSRPTRWDPNVFKNSMGITAAEVETAYAQDWICQPSSPTLATCTNVLSERITLDLNQ